MKVPQLAVLIASSCFFAQMAHSTTLNLSNNTSYDMVFSVNGECKPSFGTVPAYRLGSVSSKKVDKACGDADECYIQLFEGSCHGMYAAGIKFDRTKGYATFDNGNDPSIDIMMSYDKNSIDLFLTQLSSTKIK